MKGFYRNTSGIVLDDFDCGIAAILNICKVLYGDKFEYIDPHSELYKELHNQCYSSNSKSREKIYKQLGIQVVNRFNNIINAKIETWNGGEDNDQIIIRKNKTPLLMKVYHKKRGNHWVAVVDYEEKTDAWRVPNFEEATSARGWIFAEDLYHYSRHLNEKEKIPLFELVEK